MKKIILIIILIACFLICLCACQSSTQQNNENSQDLVEDNGHNITTPPANDAPNDDENTPFDWKAAYLDFIERRELEYDFEYLYALVHIDSDNIPELYAMGTCEADGDLICSYKNGSIIEQPLNRLAGGKYVERSGLFINQNGIMGYYYDNIYKLDDTGFSQILNASHTENYISLSESEYEIVSEYFVDGNHVSKDEYDATVNASIDLSSASYFHEDSVSYDVIKQQIADCES